jgi:phosphatidylinositol alpha-mannosyltransferase
MSGDSRHIVYVGRLEPRKGVDRLIRAMPLVQQGSPGTRLVVVGEGPDHAGLEALARNLGVDALFAGHVPAEALTGYFQAADVVCAPALGGESFGIVLLEAMAAGRPVVASQIEGYEELVARADCVRLVNVNDTAALARAITALLGDPALCRVMGAKGATFARQYDWATIARRLESIYASLRPNHTRNPFCD